MNFHQSKGRFSSTVYKETFLLAGIQHRLAHHFSMHGLSWTYDTNIWRVSYERFAKTSLFIIPSWKKNLKRIINEYNPTLFNVTRHVLVLLSPSRCIFIINRVYPYRFWLDPLAILNYRNLNGVSRAPGETVQRISHLLEKREKNETSHSYEA